MTDYYIGNKEYFKNIKKITYEGKNSDNPLAFKYYDENKKIGNKTMKEHLRFAASYWHTFRGGGSDPFGGNTKFFPWDIDQKDPLTHYKNILDASFEFFTKIGVPYYCFHDRDIAPEGKSIAQSEKWLQNIVKETKKRQEITGTKLLWGTANLFSHPRFMNGAATNPDFNVLAFSAAQVKAAMDATIELAGENYVFWGGREGYMYLFNTDMKRELEHMGKFLNLCRNYARKNGFKGTFLIEPKPMEPSKHQYDFDAATVIGFLNQYNLAGDFKLNIEANHATLANHTFAHELQVSADAGLLGSIDANRGDSQNGWDTDQFPVDIYDTVEAMLVVLQADGIKNGGLNFDAKTRRNSTDLEDIFIGYIGGMDTFARGLEIAYNIIKDGKFLKMRDSRYSSFDSGKGKEFEQDKLSLEDLRNLAADLPEPESNSAKQELFENMINQYIL
ncbi:MAG TPA: xylose isomerase [Spirochaetota bacterium]|nr:xylose isomerase [Spirochaetota bacterium]